MTIPEHGSNLTPEERDYWKRRIIEAIAMIQMEKNAGGGASMSEIAAFLRDDPRFVEGVL